MPQALSLYELNSLVRETIETTLTGEFWVEAELSEFRENRGHCYMELIQKRRQFGHAPGTGGSKMLAEHVADHKALLYPRHRSGAPRRHEASC